MLIPNLFTAAAILSALVAGIPIPANHESNEQTLSKRIDPKTNLDLSKRAGLGGAGPSEIKKKLLVVIYSGRSPEEKYFAQMRERKKQEDLEWELRRKQKSPPPEPATPPPSPPRPLSPPRPISPPPSPPHSGPSRAERGKQKVTEEERNEVERIDYYYM
ncbi:hypothetical protein HYFRA_00007263 [Hymenoscyphus fraxineus]|uniref:Uncharacterized protein n=1 Tax=Hymenoscyphus fraxineus TaxID=746836 RepID=A0A9N9PRC6_9HELO|nr:hypothetical protein HYFRA_00007263 [Hymenoscyphus fraxineus]